ncbi:hypothetical protein PAXINDRAFT_162278 [Paxillus involutus ATCC 200175]|nr:hypothetical protein PAXINDRAFT_162278 [Paxillus involutus ATCC 200175]
MAVPSSSHHDRDRERDREREREHRHRSERHHHHRTISSTTLLLVLSLVLAVLAVMLSLPASQSATAAASKEDAAAATGIWGYLNPKRSQVLVTRERDVAMREAEVARREAELLVGAPGGVLPTQSPVACPVCPTQTFFDIPPAHTIIKEVVKEQELAPPGWWKEASARAEDILDRELRVSEREREITRREESINKREHDASRREGWIMEQLVLINSDGAAVEEEIYYEQPGPKRKLKELPPIIVAETETKTIIQYETLPAQTVTVPPPANTRRAAFPTPDVVSVSFSTAIPRTTAIIYEEELVKEPLNIEEIDEYEVEEYEDGDGARVAVRRNGKPARRPPPPRSGWLW